MFGPSLALKSAWVKGAENLPRQREKAACGKTEDGDLILTGGLNKKGEPTNTVWLYDVDEKTWTTNLPKLKEERSSHGCTIVDEKVYVFGGQNRNGDNLKSVEMMNLKKIKRGWTSLPPMKQARAPLAVSSVGSTIYVFGSNVPNSEQYNHKIHGSVESFDVRNRSWNRDKLPPLPKENQAITGSTVVSGKIYLVSKNKKVTKMGKENYRTMVFDPMSSKWLSTKQLPNVTSVKRRGKDVLGPAMVFTYAYDDNISVEKENIDLDAEDIVKEVAQNADKANANVAAEGIVKTTDTGAKAGTGAGAGVGTGITSSAVSTSAVIASITGTGLVIGGVVATSVGISNSGVPVTTVPSLGPTFGPTKIPSAAPSFRPIVSRAPEPTSMPQSQFIPTPSPIALDPTEQPIREPIFQGFGNLIEFPILSSPKPTPNLVTSPTGRPSNNPTTLPLQSQIISPAMFPTVSPTFSPSLVKSSSPTALSSSTPTMLVSSIPSEVSSQLPSLTSSLAPSVSESSSPTFQPSSPPSTSPTMQPSLFPTMQPSWSPTTSFPSLYPTPSPSSSPSFSPTNVPTIECNGGCDPTNQVCIEGLCVCIEGYFQSAGLGRGPCRDIRECDNSNRNDCDRNADCIEKVGGYDCVCKDGWEGDGTQCDDINECLINDNICESDLICMNRAGSYECVSPTPVPTKKTTPPPIFAPKTFSPSSFSPSSSLSPVPGL